MKYQINTQFILDLLVSGILVLFSMKLISFVVPGSVTNLFLLRASKLIFLISCVLGIIFFISWFFNRNFKFKKKSDLPNLKDFLLLALPMSPVMDYILINKSYLNSTGFMYVVLITLVFSLFFSLILPVFFSYFASLKILISSGLALSYTILSLAKISYNPNDHLFNSQFVTQGIYLIISFAVIYLLYTFNKKITYVAVVSFMISGVAYSYLNNFDQTANKFKKSTKLTNFLKDKDNKITKNTNVYILIYESYANQETLDFYGFDNTDQIDFLEQKNFKVYHGIHSVGSGSLESTSRILELEGNLSQLDRHYTSGFAFSVNAFKANGYKTIALHKSPYFFGTHEINWDEFHPKINILELGGKTLTKAVMEGQFSFDIFDKQHNYNEYLRLKDEYLSSIKTKSLFYTHNGYPGHSQNSGKCALDEKDRYFEGMKKANIEMKRDVSNILNNDSNSIIVLLSDHGPYLTKNCREIRNYDAKSVDRFDIQDRYGAFLSIHWPKNIKYNENNIMITQDIFPAILSNITNNKQLFNTLKLERKFFDRYKNVLGNINVNNGIIRGGKDDGKPLFNNRTYNLDNLKN